MATPLPAAPAARLNAVQLRFRDQLLEKLADGQYHLEAASRCPCGAPGGELVASADRFGVPIGVVLCQICGLLRTTPRLAAGDLPAFYEQEYHGLHMGIERPSATTALFRRGQGETVYRFLRPYLPSGQLHVAEIGAGAGSVLREFAEASRADGIATTLSGCEYAAEFVEVGRRLGIDMRQGGIGALRGIDQPHVLILSHVVEHFADLGDELSAIRGLVGDKTLVYVEVPGIYAIHRKPEYEFEFAQYLTLAHTFHFVLGTLREAMARAGFRYVTGDEEARTVFQAGRDPSVLPGREARAVMISGYLEWLRADRLLKVRRAVLRGRRTTRRAARTAVRAMAGERGMRVVRGLLRREGAPRQ